MGSTRSTRCRACTTTTCSTLSSAPATPCAWSTPAMSRAQPIWRWARLWRPASRRGFGHLHETRDQAGIIARLVDHSARIDGPAEASAKVAKAIASMRQGRPGPAALECAIDVWGKRSPVALAPPTPARVPRIDEDKVTAAAKLLGKAKPVLIVAGGGAQDASIEVTQLSDLLQAPVLAYRRGRGVLDGR